MNRLHFEHDGNEWIWWVDGDYYCFYTDKKGFGIFVQDRRNGQVRQVLGTCQFSVAGLKDPRAKIRRWMIGEA